jgi:hypothetical protein
MGEGINPMAPCFSGVKDLTLRKISSVTRLGAAGL